MCPAGQPRVWAILAHPLLPVAEPAAGVRDGNHRGAQPEQGGAEMGDARGPRAQEHHPQPEGRSGTATSLGTGTRDPPGACPHVAVKSHFHTGTIREGLVIKSNAVTQN